MDNDNVTYDGLIGNVITNAKSSEKVSEAIDRILTLDGKINWDDAIQILNLAEQKIYTILQKNQVKLLKNTEKGNYKLFFDKNRKITFYPIDFNDASIIGSFLIDETLEGEIEEALKLYKKQLEDEYLIAEEYLNKLGKRNRTNLIEEIQFYFEHMAPVTVFIDQQIFSNFYDFNNLYPKSENSGNYLFPKLKQINYEKWSNKEKLFIYCMHLLINSGIQTRLEELNQSQLGIETLRKYFDEKFEYYNNFIDLNFSNWAKLTLSEKTKFLKTSFNTINENEFVYRSINGLSLQKKELVLSKKYISEENKILANFLSMLKLLVNDMTNENYDEDVLLETLMDTDIKNNNNDNYQKIINYLLENVAEDTQSDVSFCRFYTHLGELIKLIKNKDYSELIANDPVNYSCYVFLSKKLKAMFPNKVLINMSSAISSRMLYNSWHYLPGNFINENLNLSDRDFYFAPTIPDITCHDKYHHIGHVKLSINNCIRYPYHIKVANKTLNALTDIRLVKMGDEQFTLKDLYITKVYTKILASVMQTLVDKIEKHQVDFSLPSYTKKWYAKNIDVERSEIYS